jgi:hypothetical protein
MLGDALVGAAPLRRTAGRLARRAGRLARRSAAPSAAAAGRPLMSRRCALPPLPPAPAGVAHV